MSSPAVEPPAGNRATSAQLPHAQARPKWIAGFGAFRLSPDERLLQRDGVAVRLGGRALDLLIVLVDNAGRVVDKKFLIEQVWGDVVVDDGTLRFNLHAVRKALGDGVDGARYVVNSANKGYSFVARVDRRDGADPPRVEPWKRVRSLPARSAPVVGRDAEVALIGTGLVQRRLVCVVGPGGIGKTTVAVSCAQAASEHFGDDVCFIDLSSTSDAALVRGAVASVVGLQSDLDALPAIATHIGERKLLLVLDCCEHVIAEAARTAEYLVQNCPCVHVLATSREPLRAACEFVYRLQPLAFPPDGEGLTASAALAFPAVRLFVERAAATGAGFELRDGDAPLVSRLCRELDGIALAIELAAGRIEALGLATITSHLDASMKLMWHGRRTAVPRHQTLRATLDWSFDLLADDERRLLARLSVFAGSFALETAIDICGDGLEAPETIELVAGLVSKSLVNVVGGRSSLRYGLLDTTKAYCWDKLVQGGEADAVVGRFCDHFDSVVQASASEALSWESLDTLALDLPNLRAALDWRLRRSGEAAQAVELAGALCPLLLQLSRLTECVHWARSAIAVMPQERANTGCEMRLQAALGQSLMFTGGDVDAAEAALRRGIAVAESLGDSRGELHLMNGYSVLLHRGGRFDEALAVAEKSNRLLPALDDPEAAAIVDSLLGVALYFVGRPAQALHHWERSVAFGARSLTDATLKLGFDRHILSLCGTARALRLAGRHARAFEVAEDAVEKSRRFGHVITHCIALLWTGSMYIYADLDRLAVLTEELETIARRHALVPYMAVAAATRGQIMILQGDAAAGVEKIRQEVERLHACRFEALNNVFLTTMAQGLSRMSLHSAALATCDEVERRIAAGGDRLRLPELHLVKGRALAAAGDLDAAMTRYGASLEAARSQGSRPGQLRANLAIAGMLMAAGQLEDGQALLRSELAAAGGETSPDLQRARALLQAGAGRVP